MAEEQKNQEKVPAKDKAVKPADVKPIDTKTVQRAKPTGRPGGKFAKPGDKGKDRGKDDKGRGGRRPRGRRPDDRGDREFDQQILELSRVTRVTKGGKRMRFRVTMIIGDRKGRVGYGVAKGLDVQSAVQKAVGQAKKRLIKVPIVNGTIPHEMVSKYSAAKVVLKPAPKGTGIKAGGAVRVVLEFAGVPNVTAKIVGSPNKINNTKATIQALNSLMTSGRDEAAAEKKAEDASPAAEEEKQKAETKA